MTHPSTGRRSALAVPADSEHKMHRALASGADEVVIDLEDAVAAADKSRARDVLGALSWPDERPLVAVRVNAPGTPWFHRDLETVVGLPVDSIVVPKVESRADLHVVERLLDGLEAEVGRPTPLAVQALVETAAGLAGLAGIVADPRRLTSLVIGYADLAASLGRLRTAPAAVWGPAQEALLWHGRAAGLDVVDGPFLGVHDDEPFRAAASHAAMLGFDAKWVIHPRQVPAVNEIFTPSPDEVSRAERVVAALRGHGAVQLNGQLVDEAMALAARRTLARAAR